MNNYRHTHRHLYHQTGDRCWWEDCQDHHHHRHSEKRRFDRKSAKKWRRRNANLASMLRLFPLNLFCTDFLDFGIGILVIQAGLVTHSLHWAISMHLEVTEFHQVLCFDVKTIFCFVNKGLDTGRKKIMFLRAACLCEFHLKRMFYCGEWHLVWAKPDLSFAWAAAGA